MTRLDLIKEDGYWEAEIECCLYHKNYRGKNRRRGLIKDILELKNELIQLLENERKGN